MDADEVAVTRVIAVAGPVPADMIAERLRSDVGTVRDTVARLGGRALALEVDGSLVLPELLTQHFAAELQHLRPLAAVVKQALVATCRQPSTASAATPTGSSRPAWPSGSPRCWAIHRWWPAPSPPFPRTRANRCRREQVSKLTVGLVRFTPGARTNWHRHANGQLLVCTDGVGLVGTRDGRAVVLRAGESVWTPAGEEHFHGGTAQNMDRSVEDRV